MHLRSRRRTGLTSLIIGTALLAAACSAGTAASAPAATPEPPAVSAAPSASAAVPSAELIGGSITVYNAQHESLTQAWVDEFTQQTGVQVTLRNGDDPELGNLLVQEATPPRDVFLTENRRPSRWSRGRSVAPVTVRYAAVGGPNQVVSASASPSCVRSPTHATYPSGRISTAEGAATAPSAGSSHVPS